LRWGEDHPGITFSIPKMDTRKLTIIVDGEVEKPLNLSWNDFLKFPRVVSVSDFHCVEGWSVLDCRWEGVRFKDLVDSTKPKETAKFVKFECADGYTTSFALSDLLGEDIILAHRLNGEDLERSIGGPLRLVYPSKYAYKSAMWVTHVIFFSKKELGYWEIRGYSDTADVWTNDRHAR
jgi:DMSO/TMAO reductase YedYZ molybdopterin-dependent catalytic subunit